MTKRLVTLVAVAVALAVAACGTSTSSSTPAATTTPAAPATTAAPSPSISGAAQQADAALCSELAVNPGQALKTAGAVSPGLATLVGKWGFDYIGGASGQTMTDDVNEVMAWCESNGFNVLGSDPHPLAVIRALCQGVSHVLLPACYPNPRIRGNDGGIRGPAPPADGDTVGGVLAYSGGVMRRAAFKARKLLRTPTCAHISPHSPQAWGF
jgi:hypothetical protein